MSTPTTTLDPVPTRPAPPSTRLGSALIAVGGVGFALVYAVFVLTGSGQRIDNALMNAVTVSGTRHTQVDLLVPNAYLLLALAGLAGLLGLLRSWRTGMAVALAVPALALSTQVLKAVLPRPELADPWLMANSLPSGHTGAAAGLAVALLLVSPPRLLPLAALIGGALTAWMGVLVVMLGYHRPSDVIASVLLAVGALGVGLLVRDARPPAGA